MGVDDVITWGKWGEIRETKLRLKANGLKENKDHGLGPKVRT